MQATLFDAILLGAIWTLAAMLCGFILGVIIVNVRQPPTPPHRRDPANVRRLTLGEIDEYRAEQLRGRDEI